MRSPGRGSGLGIRVRTDEETTGSGTLVYMYYFTVRICADNGLYVMFVITLSC
jgi:hypothetical protein